MRRRLRRRLLRFGTQLIKGRVQWGEEENKMSRGAKVSRGLKKWRREQPKGAIMKPSTFEKIKKAAAAEGATDPEKVAGAAYWKTAKAKYRKSK